MEHWASSARTCSSDALYGKRKRLGLPFFFSATTIKCNKTLLTWEKRLSKYRKRLAWAIYLIPAGNTLFLHALLHCIFRRDWEIMSKTRDSCFIRGSKHRETDDLLFRGVWNPWWNTKDGFLTYYNKIAFPTDGWGTALAKRPLFTFAEMDRHIANSRKKHQNSEYHSQGFSGRWIPSRDPGSPRSKLFFLSREVLPQFQSPRGTT